MSEKQQNTKDNNTKSDNEVKGGTIKNVSPSTSKEDKVVVIKKEENKVPVLTKDELATLDYSDFSTPARMMQLGTVLCKSQLVPLKKPEDVVVALMTGKELGLPFITSVSQIYPINGRPTLGVHIQKALLLKNGVVFEKIDDAEAIYEFVRTDKEGKVILTEKTIKKDGKTTIIKVPIVESIGSAKEQPKDTAKKRIDFRTKYKFTRQIKMANGSYKEMIAYGSFTLIEAKEAGLTDKDVWVKYWRRMLDARAFTNGSREIADDLLLGIMTPSELDTNFYVNEKGEEVHNAAIVE